MRIRCLILSLLWISFVRADEPVSNVDGNAVIRRPYGKSEIVITTTERLAGAIHSIRWDDTEFIDSVDHGRQMQSACSFDCASGKPFHAECYNPTEAGSRADGAGPKSTSQLLRFEHGSSDLRSTTRMAFWLAPGEKSSGLPALNSTRLSNHRVSRDIRIGFQDLDNVLDYRVTFSVPADEQHQYAQFEALTGYMPERFRTFLVFDPATSELKAISDGPGEQALPVVLSTEDGRHAMGVYSPQQPSPGYRNAGYGRFRFERERVVKWNCVFRERNSEGIEAGDRTFQMYVALGTREDVRRALHALVNMAKPE